MSRNSNILAIDPGYDRMGVAVFSKNTLIHSECFSPERGELPMRLAQIHQKVRDLCSTFSPDSLALETLFFSGNQKTALAVSAARGVVMAAAAEAGVLVVEYSPQAIKIAVTGAGNASKEAVMRMVPHLISLSPKKRIDDEFDAIALGITHQVSQRFSP